MQSTGIISAIRYLVALSAQYTASTVQGVPAQRCPSWGLSVLKCSVVIRTVIGTDSNTSRTQEGVKIPI